MALQTENWAETAKRSEGNKLMPTAKLLLPIQVFRYELIAKETRSYVCL